MGGGGGRDGVGVGVGDDVTNTKPRDSSSSSSTSYTWFDLLCLILSAVAVLADLITDLVLVSEYWRKGHVYWSMATLTLVIIPAIIIQVFSIRWHLMDDSLSLYHWISHICMMGVLHRYIILFKTGLVARQSKSSDDLHRLHLQQSDICMLHLFESFLESAPQLILQLYIMFVMENWQFFTGISIVASLCSLSWAIVSYIQALRRAHTNNKKLHKCGIILQVIWRGSMLAARLSALFLFVIGFQKWIFLLLGGHWLVMTLWIFCQKTDFCPTKVEEVLYNCVVGVIYCFCFFNLREGQSRYRMIAFYTFMITQNMVCLLLCIFCAQYDTLRKEIFIITSAIIICGTLLGLLSMTMYYRWLHPTGPIKWTLKISPLNSNIETESKSVDKTFHNPSATLRSLKSTCHSTDQSVLSCTGVSLENSPHSETEGVLDKKQLIEQRNHSAIGNDVSGIEFYSVVNSPESNKNTPISMHSKRRGFCHPTDLSVKYTKTDQNEGAITFNDKYTSQEAAKKRRAICSSEQLNDNLDNKFEDLKSQTDNVTSNDSVNIDMDLTFSDINSSDINEFNENIVQKLCLSTLKNIKNVHQDADIQNIQRIALDILKDLYNKGGVLDDQDLQSEISSSLGRDLETPSEVMSAHDYENICAVNIAREAWGLRSWRGCVDMEASPPPPPLPARGNIPAAPPLLTPSPLSNNQDYEISGIVCDNNTCHVTDHHNDGEASLFLAKPYVIDQNGRVVPLPIPLEPILEEIDEIKENNRMKQKRQRYNSASSLVATIDEIRNDPISNSPRNVYHRSDCDSPYSRNSEKNQILKEKNMFSHSNKHARKLLDEKIIQQKIANTSAKIKETEDELRVMDLSKAILENCKRSYCKKYKKNNESVADKIADVVKCLNNDIIESGISTQRILKSSKDITSQDKVLKKENNVKKNQSPSFITQLMTENESSNNLKSSSLQSLIDSNCNNSSVVAPKYNVEWTGNKKYNRPRRKFSLLREKFEPKTKFSDEEMLFQSMESIKSSSQNKLDQIEPDVKNCNNSARNNDKMSDLQSAHQDFRDPQSILSKMSCDIQNNKDSISFSLKEKRSLFLKQVLSPPKINTWNKK